MSSSERDHGWAIEVALGDNTDEHTGGEDSEISPVDGAQCQKILYGYFAPETPPGADDLWVTDVGCSGLTLYGPFDVSIVGVFSDFSSAVSL